MRFETNNLRKLEGGISIPIPRDPDGYTGRECPKTECQGYFKVTFGTGMKGTTCCYCPYCGYVGEQKEFWTRDQIEYMKSIAANRITKAIAEDLGSLLKRKMSIQRPSSDVGIAITMKVEARPRPIRYYREKQLETEVVCDHCTLRYAIYGVFAFCPDCGKHNSLQILNKNLELVQKEISLAATLEHDLSEHLVGDALENAVSAFDGFAREACQVHAALSSLPTEAQGLSFQNLPNARDRIIKLFGFDFSAGIEPEEWEFACRCFQKRHLLAHKMGIVDEAYLKTTNDSQAVLGRKVPIASDEVEDLIGILGKLGSYLVAQFPDS